MRKWILMTALLVLPGCMAGGPGLVAPKSPAQVVFETKAAEAAALTVFLRYRALPGCLPAAAAALCSDSKVVASVQQADVVAAKAIDAAETAVRTAGFPASTVQTLLSAATAAVAALATQTATLRTN